MAPVISDGMVWEDLSARMAARAEVTSARIEDDELDAMLDMCAEHLGIDRQRVGSVYVARLFNVGAG